VRWGLEIDGSLSLRRGGVVCRLEGLWVLGLGQNQGKKGGRKGYSSKRGTMGKKQNEKAGNVGGGGR